MPFAPEHSLRDPREPRPRPIVVVRVIGLLIAGGTALASALTDPGAGLSGRGPLITLCIVAFLGAVAYGAPRRDLPPGHRFFALLGLALASIGLILLQGEHSSALSGVYIAVIFAGLRLPDRQGLVVLVVTVAGSAAAYSLALTDASNVGTVLLGVPPWYVVMRVLRQQRARQMRADALVEELRSSRAAEALAAAEAERTRVARDMHDVLAHTLSALTIQLELARVQARGTDAEATVTDAHARAVSGLGEARRAIGALRGDELPGPERLPELVAEHPGARFVVSGEARDLPSEARLALYRVAQEALTNVRRHAAEGARVDVELAWGPGEVELTVADHAPVAVSSRSAPTGGGRMDLSGVAGGGHGLTGMRERAELLGGRLEACRTEGGFRVALWLPA